jgi:hypothetical protein
MPTSICSFKDRKEAKRNTLPFIANAHVNMVVQRIPYDR